MDATIVGRETRVVGYAESAAGLDRAWWEQAEMPVIGEVVEVEHAGLAVGRVTVYERSWLPFGKVWRVCAARPRG